MAPHALRTRIAACSLVVLATFTGGEARAAFPPLPAGTADDVYHATFDHYLITHDPEEIAALDEGAFASR